MGIYSVKNSISKLASILNRKYAYAGVINNEKDMLIQSCRLVAKHSGFEISIPTEKSGTLSELFSRILRESNVRSRKVELDKNWWKTDNGALLGFYHDKYCALIPDNRLGYSLVELCSGKKIVISDEINKHISDHAYILFPPLDNQNNTLFKMIKSQLFGLGGDIKQLLLVHFFIALLSLLTPLLTGLLFEIVIPNANLDLLSQFSVAFAVSIIVMILLNLSQTYTRMHLNYKLEVKMETSVWGKLLKLPVNFYKKYSSGDIGYRIELLSSIQLTLIDTSIAIIIGGITGIILLTYLFFYSQLLTVYVLFSSLVIIAVKVYMSLKRLKYLDKMHRLYAQESSITLQIITGLHKFKVFNSENVAFGLWVEKFSKRQKYNRSLAALAIYQSLIDKGIMIVNTIVLFVLVVSLGDKMPFPTYIAFNAAYVAFLATIIGFADQVSSFLMLKPEFELVKPLISAETESDAGRSDVSELKGNISVQNVAFRYNEDENLIYKNLNIDICEGDVIGIVGPSGAGKSTLFRLLLGFEEVDQGDIYYDNININQIKLSSLREQIGVSLQNSALVPGTVLDNIIGQNSEYTRQDAWEIARWVGAEKMIKDLPMQMDTYVNDGIQTFSGGEAQRLVIARAIASKSKVLFLDEATSALDNETQASVLGYLKEAKVTQVIAAHRLSTLTYTDKIYVLDKGCIVQSGNYQELLQRPGLFAELVKNQLV